MPNIPNLLIIAGSGTKSGKTTMACKLIEQFREFSITAIKITPHFHDTTPGLKVVCKEPEYEIYEETDSDSNKDTSRMLHAGASKVYFAKVYDDKLLLVFNKIKELIPARTPIICESPALAYYVTPGVFIIMTSEATHKYKNISHLQKLPHLNFKIGELSAMLVLPVKFDGRWSYNRL